MTNEVTQSGLPSFAWNPQGTGALVSAEAPCAHLPPQGGQTNFEYSKFVAEACLSNLSLSEDQMSHNLQPRLEKDII